MDLKKYEGIPILIYKDEVWLSLPAVEKLYDVRANTIRAYIARNQVLKEEDYMKYENTWYLKEKVCGERWVAREK